MSVPFVEVKHLAKQFGPAAKPLHVLKDISFSIHKGEVLGLVGESGSGKTTIGRALLRLIEPSSGQVLIDGHDITAMGQKALNTLRPRMQYIFQDPFASLSPRMTIGEILTEGLAIQRIGSAQERRKRALEGLDMVEMPANAIDRYAHEFSGGQRQRIGIARALTMKPDFIVADEPVSALDVSIQAQIINLLRRLQQELSLTMLFISHDLAVVEYIADRVIVLYMGRMMEVAPAEHLFAHAAHPYTQALLASVPDPHRTGKPLSLLSGDIPSLANPPSGCVFRTRCPRVSGPCSTTLPLLHRVAEGHEAACLFL